MKIDRSVKEIGEIGSGEAAARKVLESLILDRLINYHRRILDPVARGQSGLSPYLHFGQLSSPEYDSVGAFPEWARISLNGHRSDKREHIYTLEQLENARTHDLLWNAAQTEMVKIG